MDYNMTKTTALIIAVALIGFGVATLKGARAQEAKYDWKPSADCKPGVTANKDGSTTYALPYPSFSTGPKNERGEATVVATLAGLILFKQQNPKTGVSGNHNCGK